MNLFSLTQALGLQNAPLNSTNYAPNQPCFNTNRQNYGQNQISQNIQSHFNTRRSFAQYQPFANQAQPN